jgi:hypothetical protein
MITNKKKQQSKSLLSKMMLIPFDTSRFFLVESHN